jgi:hypothetical protein
LDFQKRGVEAPPPTAELLAVYGRHRAKIRAWKEAGRTDLLEQVCHSLKLFLQSSEAYEAVSANACRWKNLGRLLTDLPPDLAKNVREFLQGHGCDVPKAIGKSA